MAITANANLEVAQIAADTGITLTMTAADATDGHKFDNDGKTFLLVANDSVGSRTVTIETGLAHGSLAVEDVTLVIALGNKAMFGPFDETVFNVPIGQTDAGRVKFGFDAASSTTFALVRY